MLGWSLPDSCLKAVFYCLTEDSPFLLSQVKQASSFHSFFLLLCFSPSFFPSSFPPFFPFSLFNPSSFYLSLHHLYPLTHLNPVSVVCWLNPLRNRAALLSAPLKLQDHIKLLIRPFRRPQPPHCLHHSPPQIQTIHSSFPFNFLLCCLPWVTSHFPLSLLLHLKLAKRIHTYPRWTCGALLQAVQK